MVKNTFFYLLNILIACVITACGKEKVIFEKEYPIQNQKWTYADTLDFSFDIADTMAIYDIVLEVKHSMAYPMQNIYTQIYTKFPTGERVKQLLSLDLADNTGKWEGDCSGNNCDFTLKLQENAFFNIAGKHIITLEQYTRELSLPAIERIGLKIVDKGIKRDLAKEQEARGKGKKK
jgi:gliding motility-associated lipoprotein GldH